MGFEAAIVVLSLLPLKVFYQVLLAKLVELSVLILLRSGLLIFEIQLGLNVLTICLLNFFQF